MKRHQLSKALSLILTFALAIQVASPAFAAEQPLAGEKDSASITEGFEVPEEEAAPLIMDYDTTAETKPVQNDVVDLAAEPLVEAEVAPTGTVGSFSVPAAYTKAYDAAFAVQAASVVTNGGKYGSSVVTNVIDGNTNTHWETGRANGGNFANYLTFTFAEPETLGSVVYYPRVQGAANKGFPTAFSIYASQSGSGEDFTLVFQGTAKVAGGGTQIAFPETSFKRLRFVFDTCQANWAACGEMKFYRADLLPAQVDKLFADGTWSALADGMTNEDIDALVNGMAEHPLRDLYADALDLAAQLADGQTAPGVTVYDVPARGPYGDDIGRASTWNQLFPYQPTGYYAVPGTTLDVYVEPGFADGQTGSLPQIVFGQIAKDKNGWGRRFNLKEGHNVIKVPGVENMNPGAIYFVNHNYGYTGIAPDIRFVDASGGDGVRRFPLFYQDDSTANTGYLPDRRDEAAFLEELEAYIPTLSETDAQAAAGEGNYNICELGSANVLVSTSATGARNGLKQNGLDRRTGETLSGPSDMMTLHEENYNHMMTYAGYEPERLGETAAPNQSDPLYRQYRPIGRFMIRVFCQGPFGWGDAGYIGFNGGFSENNKRGGDMFSAVASCAQITGAGWGLEHELGHLLEGSRVGRAEYTNNLFSLQFQNEFQVANRVSARFREDILKYNNNDYKLDARPGYIGGNFVLLAILYQLEAVYGDHGNAFSADSVYAKTLRWSRDNGGRLGGLESGDTLSMNRFAVAASNALGIDVTNHFEHYGIEITDAARKQLDPDLAPNTKKTWLATSAADAKDVQTLPENAAASVELSREDGKAVLTMDVPGAAEGAVQTYEILRDGEFAAYVLAGNASNVPVAVPSNLVTWTDANGADGADHVYTVRAYDARLNVSADSEPVTFRANEPYLVLDGSTLLPIHQEFDPLSVVKAHAADGQDLTGSVTIAESDLDMDVRGSYTVTYTVADEAGNTTSLTVPFTVISSFVYASDVEEQSAKVGWGQFRKDKNIQGGTITLLKDGAQVPFAKGLGAHAASEIVYDLTGTGYTWFESFVGIDQAMKNAAAAKAKFQVYVDGKLCYDSGAMLANTPMKHVAIDLAGAEELRLVTDGMGANSSDHTVWAGARFAKESSAPVIHVQDAAFTDPADVDLDALVAEATATDVEDGDLTDSLTYETDYAPGKTGVFTVTYSVTDSDGNTTEAVQSLVVVNSFVYVSDQNWKSAKVGWGSIKRDKSLNGNAIKLATNDGVQAYEKGLGVHATSEVVYDLTGKDFYYFTSQVGVDNTAGNNLSSVVFRVFVDGELMAETPVMRKGTPAETLSVSLAGAKTLKLVVTDGGNGNANDHANWADAKFLTAVAEADKESLSELVERASTLEEDRYTIESWEVLTEALAMAEDVLSRPDASQEETDEALAGLTDAMDALETLLDTEALEEMVELARSVATLENVSPINTKHQQAIVNNVLAAVAGAEEALADPDLTQEEIDRQYAIVRYYLWDMNPDFTPGWEPFPSR